MNQQLRSNAGARAAGACAVIVLCGALAGVVWSWRFDVQTRIDARTGSIQRAEMEWRNVSLLLPDAERRRSVADLFLRRADTVLKERRAGGWTPALRVLSAAAGADIELRDIRASQVASNPKACTLHVEGIATGQAPRATADRFAHSLLDGLREHCGQLMTVRFERLEEVIPTIGSPARKAIFVIIATPAAAPRGDPEKHGAI